MSTPVPGLTAEPTCSGGLHKGLGLCNADRNGSRLHYEVLHHAVVQIRQRFSRADYGMRLLVFYLTDTKHGMRHVPCY